MSGRKRLFESLVGSVGSKPSKIPKTTASRTSTFTPKSTVQAAKKAWKHDFGGPLKGVVASLSGMSALQKVELHKLIERLGGSYTSDLNLDKNTHLITDTPSGAKYDAAKEVLDSGSGSICIVSTAWLRTCSDRSSRIDESFFSVGEDGTRKEEPCAVLLQQLEILLNNNNTHSNADGGRTNQNLPQVKSLFACEFFHLVGFEDGSRLKQQLGKLIRRGLGTICWEINDMVTMLVMNYDCPDALRKSARNIAAKHVNRPETISPDWIIESWKDNCLAMTSEFPPYQQVVDTAAAAAAAATSRCSEKQTQQKIVPVRNSTDNNNSNNRPIKPTTMTTATTLARRNSRTNIFNGCLFSLLRIAPPVWAIDFDKQKLDVFIRSHGGRILSLELANALHADAAAAAAAAAAAKSETQVAPETRRRRICYVVCWGGGGRPYWQNDPIISKLVEGKCCDIKLVSPIWVKTCASVRKLVCPDENPFFSLVPQEWPIQKIDCKCYVAVTSDFERVEKAALQFLLLKMGAKVSKAVDSSCTHLIVNKGTSVARTETAIPAKLKVVSVDWVYHIAQYGYGGERKQKGGCESHFHVETTTNKPPPPAAAAAATSTG